MTHRNKDENKPFSWDKYSKARASSQGTPPQDMSDDILNRLIETQRLEFIRLREGLEKIAVEPLGSHAVRRMAEELLSSISKLAASSQGTGWAEAIRLLALMYDRWEEGTQCYEDPEDCGGFLGHAVKLSEEEENQIIAILPPRALPTDSDYFRVDTAEGQLILDQTRRAEETELRSEDLASQLKAAQRELADVRTEHSNILEDSLALQVQLSAAQRDNEKLQEGKNSWRRATERLRGELSVAEALVGELRTVGERVAGAAKRMEHNSSGGWSGRAEVDAAVTAWAALMLRAEELLNPRTLKVKSDGSDNA
ncbi:MAG: hypothetical protein JWQ87_5430 [Candidatus Sulfotelmatobacter sp.]|nr:hypothetical protein [Candidatus Sulfotelmatobacter sp.]